MRHPSDEVHDLMAETLEAIQRGEMQPEKLPWWWELRREGEMTPEYLGRVLAGLGLSDLAARARMGHFDDFHAPAEVAELRAAAKTAPDVTRDRIAAVENAVRRGEFDATRAESDRWAASKDGQETFGLLAASAVTDYMVGRNEPCPCGSGKKFKRCHGA